MFPKVRFGIRQPNQTDDPGWFGPDQTNSVKSRVNSGKYHQKEALEGFFSLKRTRLRAISAGVGNNHAP